MDRGGGAVDSLGFPMAITPEQQKDRLESSKLAQSHDKDWAKYRERQRLPNEAKLKKILRKVRLHPVCKRRKGMRGSELRARQLQGWVLTSCPPRGRSCWCHYSLHSSACQLPGASGTQRINARAMAHAPAVPQAGVPPDLRGWVWSEVSTAASECLVLVWC